MDIKKIGLWIMLFLVGCGAPKDDQKESTNSAWPEMDAFHEVMAQSFHPYKDSSNLGPAKEHAGKMMELASAWAEASLPEGVPADEVVPLITKLKEGTALFSEQVKVEEDSALGVSLTALHDLFHAIHEKGKAKGEPEHHHQH